MSAASRPGGEPVGTGDHKILLKPACAVNIHGDIEISRSMQIMVEHGKGLAFSSIDELQDPEEL
jgi:hypothetical protein